MESGPLSSPEFKEFAKKVVLFCHVTSRIPTDKYQSLLQEKGGQGFPYLVYLDAEGDVVGKPGGRDVGSFTKGAQVAQSYLTLKAKTDRTTGEEVELLAAEIGLGKVTVEKAEERKGSIAGISDEQKKKIDDALVDLRVMAKVQGLQRNDVAGIAAAGKAFYEMHQQGLRPQGEEAFQPFYMLIMRHGQAEKSADIFEIGLTAMKEKFGHNPQAAKFFEAQEKVLEELRGADGK